MSQPFPAMCIDVVYLVNLLPNEMSAVKQLRRNEDINMNFMNRFDDIFTIL